MAPNRHSPRIASDSLSDGHGAPPPSRSPFEDSSLQGTSFDDEAGADSFPSTADVHDSVNSLQTRRAGEPALTFRSVGGGLLVGSILCCSNTYFGLQTGWITMGSLQSAILGFGAFRILERYGWGPGLSIAENVILQTTAVATSAMPLAAGLVGVIPAFTLLTPNQNPPFGALVLSTGQLMLWSLALATLGPFIAVPLRTQTIVREKLTFPSGTATAKVIKTLHGTAEELVDMPGDLSKKEQLRRRCRRGAVPEEAPLLGDGPGLRADLEDGAGPRASAMLNGAASGRRSKSRGPSLDLDSLLSLARADSYLHCSSAPAKHALHPAPGASGADASAEGEFERAWATLLWTFVAAGAYSLAATFVPWLKSFAVATWLGWPAATRWGWELAPSMGYIGQGMIMGPKTAASMLFGAVLGWGVLGPAARAAGWAPGPVEDSKDGAAGWILWISLAIMLGDSLTSLSLLCITSMRDSYMRFRRGEAQVDADPCPPNSRIPTLWWAAGLVGSAALVTAVLSPMLHLPFYEPLAAVALAGVVALVAVRALGMTDLNPVSGVGKFSQIVFALIAPQQVVPNLVAGAVAEAGAAQAGEMMQDFKTAHLLGVCPRAQFFAQLIGSAASALISVGAYALYTHAWTVPGPNFPVPSARIWLDMADLVNGGALPPHVIPFCIRAAAVAGAIPLINLGVRWVGQHLECACLEVEPTRWQRAVYGAVSFVEWAMPSGIAVAVGMYVAPKWTVPRVLGSLAEQLWLRAAPASHRALMILVASGLVLGEGTASIASAFLTAALK